MGESGENGETDKENARSDYRIWIPVSGSYSIPAAEPVKRDVHKFASNVKCMHASRGNIIFILYLCLKTSQSFFKPRCKLDIL